MDFLRLPEELQANIISRVPYNCGAVIYLQATNFRGITVDREHVDEPPNVLIATAWPATVIRVEAVSSTSLIRQSLIQALKNVLSVFAPTEVRNLLQEDGMLLVQDDGIHTAREQYARVVDALQRTRSSFESVQPHGLLVQPLTGRDADGNEVVIPDAHWVCITNLPLELAVIRARLLSPRVTTQSSVR